ncbi:hypothetical protein AB1N83_009744 [Pleurotus pulmonarius]
MQRFVKTELRLAAMADIHKTFFTFPRLGLILLGLCYETPRPPQEEEKVLVAMLEETAIYDHTCGYRFMSNIKCIVDLTLAKCSDHRSLLEASPTHPNHALQSATSSRRLSQTFIDTKSHYVYCPCATWRDAASVAACSTAEQQRFVEVPGIKGESSWLEARGRYSFQEDDEQRGVVILIHVQDRSYEEHPHPGLSPQRETATSSQNFKDPGALDY